MDKEKELDYEDCPVCEEVIWIDITNAADGTEVEIECPHCKAPLTGEVVKYVCLYSAEEDDDD